MGTRVSFFFFFVMVKSKLPTEFYFSRTNAY